MLEWGGEKIRFTDMSVIQAPAPNKYNVQFVPVGNTCSEQEIKLLSAVRSEVESGSLLNVKGKITRSKLLERII